MDACSGSGDDDEDIEAKAERLSQRLRAADVNPLPSATGSHQRSRRQLVQGDGALTEAAAGRDGSAAIGSEPVNGAQRTGRKITSGRVNLFEASVAVERDGQRAAATQLTSAADVSGVLADVRQHQASVADQDWLFGGADVGSDDTADVPARPAEKQAPKSSAGRKGADSGAVAPSVSTEHREFIRAKKFSGEPPATLAAATRLTRASLPPLIYCRWAWEQVTARMWRQRL